MQYNLNYIQHSLRISTRCVIISGYNIKKKEKIYTFKFVAIDIKLSVFLYKTNQKNGNIFIQH